MDATHLISCHTRDLNTNLNLHLEEESYLVCQALLRARTTFEKISQLCLTSLRHFWWPDTKAFPLSL